MVGIFLIAKFGILNSLRNIEWFVGFLHLQIPLVEISKYLRTRLSVCLLLACLIYSGMIFSYTSMFMFHLRYKELIFLPPSCCSDKTDMAIRLFTALRSEDQSLRLTIQEAATSLAGAYKVFFFSV